METPDLLGAVLAGYKSKIEEGVSDEDFREILNRIRLEAGNVCPEIVEAAIVVPVTLDGNLLVLERSPKDRYKPNGLSFPGGQSNKGEALIQTAAREAFEETGIGLLQDDLRQRSIKVRTVRIDQKTENSCKRIYEIAVFDTVLPFTTEQVHSKVKFECNEVGFFEHAAYWLISQGSTQGVRIGFNTSERKFVEHRVGPVPVGDHTGYFTKRTIEAWINNSK